MKGELLLRAHRNDKRIVKAIYRIKKKEEDGLSTNWSNRSSPEVTRQCEHVNKKLEAKNFGVVSINIPDIENIRYKGDKPLNVNYNPI